MKLLTVKDFINILSEQNADGDKVVFFRVEDDDEDIIAFGELCPSQISVTQKSAYQTCEGDKDVIRVTLKLCRS